MFVRGFDVSALGSRLRIEPDAAVADDVVARAEASWADARAEGGGDPVATVVLRGEDADSMLERLSVDVTLAALERHKGSALMFHAGGVADADGRVFAFVGPSGRGKTTMIRALAVRYGYVSDEAIAVTPGRVVHAYRKPLSIVRAGAPKEQVLPAELGLLPLPPAPLRLAALCVLNRIEGGAEPTLERVSLAEVMDEIVAQMSYFAELEAPLQTLAALLDETGGLLRLTYSEAVTVLPLIEQFFAEGEPAPAPEPVVAAMPAPEGAPRASADLVDAIDAGDWAAVLTGRMVRVLGGIAPEVWRALMRGADDAEVVRAVVDRFGAPPDGAAVDAVAAAISELVEAGLVEPAGEQTEAVL